MDTLNFFLKHLKKYRKTIILMIIFLLFETLVEVVSPTILSDIVQNGIGMNDKNYIFYRFILLIILTVVGVLGSIVSSYFSASFSSGMIYDLRKEIFDTLTSLSFDKIGRLDVSKATTVLSNDIETIGTVVSYGIKVFLKAPILLIGSLLFSFMLSKRLFLILAFLLPILLIFIYQILRKATPYFDSTKEALDRTNKVVRENISGKKLIKVMHTEKLETKKFQEKNKILMNQNMGAMKTITMISPIAMFFTYLAIYLVLIFGYDFLQEEIITIGVLMAFLQYLTILLTSLLLLAMLLLLLSQTWVSLKRVFEICSMEKEFKTIGSLNLKNSDITLDHVSFSYGNHTNNALNDICLEVKKGEKIAVVGRCGSGKTTFLKLLAGFYEPTNGQILLEGKTISDYKDIREKVVYNSQKMVLFHGTIKSNISFFKRIGHLEKILHISKVNEITSKKELGLLSGVEAYGSNLSGGEKNRISLARCLNRNFEILLLDDSLSAVDLKSENQILKRLNDNAKDKTIFYVTSRLTSLNQMDKILVLEKGKVEAFGTLEEVSRNPVFKELYQLKEEVQHGS